MSAMLGVRQSNAIHILTDAATTAVWDGTVGAIHDKQVRTRCGVLIAGVGIWAPCRRFARLIDERASSFDEAIAAFETAPELWDEARAKLPPWAKKEPYATLLAGWSDKNDCLELYVLQSTPGVFASDPDAWDLASCEVYGAGPSDECKEFVASFVKRIYGDRDAFDARRDGVAFFETLRRDYPRQYKTTRRPAVGGYVQWTTITRDDIQTAVIQHWPDRVGHKIEIQDGGNGSGLNRGDISKVFGVILGQMTDEEKASLLAARER